MHPRSGARFIGGVFTYNWAKLSSCLPKGEAAKKKKSTERELSRPLFPGPRQRHPGRRRAGGWCLFWSKSLKLSAASTSSATWLLLDRFVPLIRADADCGRCTCKEKMAEPNPAALVCGNTLSGPCFRVQCVGSHTMYRMISVISSANEITLQKPLFRLVVAALRHWLQK